MIVKVGCIKIGIKQAIVIQSMTNISALNINANIEQCKNLYKKGCKIIRFATQSAKEIEAVKEIKQKLQSEFTDLVIVADTHFSPSVAELATEVFDKVRINPGNFIDKNPKQKIYTNIEFEDDLKKIEAKFSSFIQKCKQTNTVIRIGTNHGSLSDRITQKFGNSPLGMVESVCEFLNIAEKYQFENIIISLKASSPKLMIEANRLMMQRMQKNMQMYPIHLGVTEAGNGDYGRIKSAVGIGSLLLQGIGNTIRVSLSETPENEIAPANDIIKITRSKKHYTANYGIRYNNYEAITLFRQNPPLVISPSKTTDEAMMPDFYINENQIISNGTEIATNLNIANCKIIELIPELRQMPKDAMFAFRICFNYYNIEVVKLLKPYKNAVLIIRYIPDNYYSVNMRKAIDLMKVEDMNNRVILEWESKDKNWESFIIYTSVQLGSLMVDNYADGILIVNKNFETKKLNDLAFKILQASSRKQSMPEIISCPTCGRTLFDVETKVNELKKQLPKIKNVKIAVMGCIVNGLGEMADADYGFIGVGENKINLFYKKQLVKKNIESENAVNQLMKLLKDNDDIKSL